jgi:hypothetical protein
LSFNQKYKFLIKKRENLLENKMLIENKGITTDTFYITSFDLKERELVVINLPNGKHFYEIQKLLKNIFCGIVSNKDVVVYEKLFFVEHFTESKFKHFFNPETVGEYLKKNANLNSIFSTKIYDINWINQNTKINTLAGNQKGLLSLYSTLSKTKNIVFDVIGQDQTGVDETCEIVKEVVKNDGSAILIDCFESMKNECTKFIELKWKK